MIITDVKLQWVELQNMRWLWRWRWDDSTPWPDVGEPKDPQLFVHGHFVGNETGENLPFRVYYPLFDAQVSLLRDAILPIARRIVFSKEQPWRGLFGGLVVDLVQAKDWTAKPTHTAKEEVHPYGLAIEYTRFTRGGVLLPEYQDAAMWERSPRNPLMVAETHRGAIDDVAAAEFREDMGQVWDMLKAVVIQQERERLGI